MRGVQGGERLNSKQFCFLAFLVSVAILIYSVVLSLTLRVKFTFALLIVCIALSIIGIILFLLLLVGYGAKHIYDALGE